MDVRWRALALVLFTAGACSAAHAQSSATAATFVTVNEALETDGRSMTLPDSATGVMTLLPCTTCTMKTLRSTANTLYKLRDVPVSLAEFRNALAVNSETFVTVLYSVKTLELVSVTASLDAEAARSR